MDLFKRPAPLRRTNLVVGLQIFFFLSSFADLYLAVVFDKLMVFSDNLPCSFPSTAVLSTSAYHHSRGIKNHNAYFSLSADCGAGVGGSAVSADGWRSCAL